MSKLNAASMEAKVRQVTHVPGPSQAFITALWEKLDQAPRPSQPVMTRQPWYRRPVWVILTVLLVLVAALFIGFGPRNVSAFIRQFLGFEDSGLQAVQEAGLVTDLDMTAEPTFVRSTDSPTNFPKDVYPLTLSQTIEGITVTLDWVYVDEGRMTIALTADPLPHELLFDLPIVSIEGAAASFSGGGMSQSSGDKGTHVLFDIYQIFQVDVVGDTIDFSLDVPLTYLNEPDQESLATFHFDLQDIPVYRGSSIPLTQTTSVTLDGVEVQLKSVRVMPSITELEVCYDFPPGDESSWYMPQPSLQIDDGPEETGYAFHYLGENEGKHCAKIEFRLGNAGGGDQLIFRVNSLFVPLPDELPDEKIYAANETLAEYGIEIAPAEGDYSDGPGGWVFVQTPQWELYSEDPRWLVINALREKMTGPWTFYVDLPQPEDFAMTDEGQVADPTPTVTD